MNEPMIWYTNQYIYESIMFPINDDVMIVTMI